MCGRTSGGIAKILYLLYIALSFVLAIILKFGDQLNVPTSFTSCNGDAVCLGNQAVYRISFAVAVWFIAVGCFTPCFPDFHYGWWFTKLGMYLAILVCSFFIPNAFFDGYVELARVVSFIFLILQILILIALAYDLHDYLSGFQAEGSESENCCKAFYLVLCFLLLALGMTGIGLLYHFLGGCSLNKFFISMTLILGVAGTVISVTNRVGKGLLTPLVVFDYCVYLCWQAIYSSPDVNCNPNAEETNDTALIIVGLAIAVASLTYTSWSAGTTGINIFRTEPTEADAAAVSSPPAEDPEAKKEAKAADAAEGGPRSATADEIADLKKRGSHSFFHFVMAMGGVYMSMVLTNWGSNTYGGNSSGATVSWESMWIKITSQWVTFAFYLWTMLAPICFPDRDFSNGHNMFRN